jgi:tripartite-type tricarboxylate transporter receptor subunit TctC
MLPSRVARLNRAMVAILGKTDVSKFMDSQGIEAASGTPEEFNDCIKSDINKSAGVITIAGMTPE